MLRGRRNPRLRISRPDYIKHVVVSGLHRYLFRVTTSPCFQLPEGLLFDYLSSFSAHSTSIKHAETSSCYWKSTCRHTVVYRWVRSVFRLSPIYTGLTTVIVSAMAKKPRSVSFDLIRLRNLFTSSTYGDSPISYVLEIVGTPWTGHAHSPYVQ